MTRDPIGSSVASGLSWLGEVPAGWSVGPLSRGFEVTLGKMLQPEQTSHLERLLPYLRAGNIKWKGVDTADIKSMWLTPTEQRELKLAKGDLLVSEGGDVGRACIWREELAECYFQNSVNRVRPRGQSSVRFLYFWLSALKAIGYIDVVCNKATIAHLTAEKLAALPVPYPPADLQSDIADYLERATVRHESKLKELSDSIELLTQQRQAIITRAVTRGISNSPLQQTGIPWMPEVPKHWGFGAFRHVTERVVVGIAEAATHAYVDGGIPILRSTNIRPNRIQGEILTVDPEFAQARGSKAMKAGDLVTVRTGNPGVTAVIPEELHGSQCFTMLISTLQEGQHAEYFSHVLNSDAARQYFGVEGWGSAQLNISVPILKMVTVPMPPLAEQVAITSWLTKELAQIDRFIDEAEKLVELLKRRQQRLIFETVTGKRALPQAAAQAAFDEPLAEAL